jgi:hypothetical protein
MIQNKCSHKWIHRNNYIPAGGGSVQPMYGCERCDIQLPASEVFQLEALENQNQELKHLKGFGKYTAIIALVISFIALIVPIINSFPNQLGQLTKNPILSEKINPIYFYSSAYEDKNGFYAIQCPQTKDIDWQLAVYTLSAYMQFEVQGEDLGPAEIQRNFDKNCERNMKIYKDLGPQIGNL